MCNILFNSQFVTLMAKEKNERSFLYSLIHGHINLERTRDKYVKSVWIVNLYLCVPKEHILQLIIN